MIASIPLSKEEEEKKKEKHVRYIDLYGESTFFFCNHADTRGLSRAIMKLPH